MFLTMMFMTFLYFDSVSGTAMEYFGHTLANGQSFSYSADSLYWDIKEVIRLFKINGEEVDSNRDGVWNPVIDSVLGTGILSTFYSTLQI